MEPLQRKSLTRNDRNLEKLALGVPAPPDPALYSKSSRQRSLRRKRPPLSCWKAQTSDNCGFLPFKYLPKLLFSQFFVLMYRGEDSRVLGDLRVDRSVARYRNAAAAVSFAEPTTAFSYATSFMPGVHFYTFLAAKEAVPPRTARGNHSNSVSGNSNTSGDASGNSRLTSRKQNSALKLNVPDTILYGETGRAVWIYTDKDGYVQRLTEFSDKQVLDKFAEGPPVIADEQHLIVYKEPMTTMANQQKSTSLQGPPVFNSQGNQLRLLNLGEVKTLLNGVMAMHKAFALQQFVKCNGSKAFIQRAVYETGKPPHAWMISNIEPFRDSTAPLSPTSAIAGPQNSPRPGLVRSSSSSTIGISGADGPWAIPLVSRLCTSIQIDKGCTFVKLTERGCAAISELNFRTFVADFIKDATGEWWLLQVKAFQIRNNVHPGRAFTLPLKLRLAYLNYRDTVILDEDEDENVDCENPRRKARHRHHRRAIIPLSQRNIHKLVQCKCCLAAYPSSELSFKMTLKMISDMLLRIRSRLPPEKTLPFLSAAFARELPESAVAYESWSVCSYCYAIYERDQQLQRIEIKFSAALGLPNTKTMAEGLSQIHDRGYALDPTVSASVMPPQLTQCRLVLVINAIYDIPPELYNAEQENARIEAAADEIAAAEGKKRAQRSNASRLYLRINALGYTECIPVNPADILEASEKAPIGARRRRDSCTSSVSDEDDEESRGDSDQSEPRSSRRQRSWQHLSRSQTFRHRQPPSNNDVNYWLPTNLIRTVPFFAPRTPLQSKLKETSGITQFLTEDNSVRVQLIRATEPPLQDPMSLSSARRRPKNRRAALVPPAGSMSDLVMQIHGPSHAVVLGSTKIRMTQFRSSYVTKIDYYACMAITGEMLNIKGNIGLERVRYVDSKLLTSQHRLRVYNGIFVPDDSYTTSDALSSEWMDCFRASNYAVKRQPLTVSTTAKPIEVSKKTTKSQGRSTSSSQGSSKQHRVTRPTSSRSSLMDEDEEMDKELEQMIERANLKQQEAHFRQMGLNNAQTALNTNEDNAKTVSAATIKQQLLRGSTGPAHSASQMSMLLNKPIISPRSELADFAGPEDNNSPPPAGGTSMILPSPRNRKWMWSLRRSALERLPTTSRNRLGTLLTSASADAIPSQTAPISSHLEAQFNCTHKFWLAGTTRMVQAYLRNNPALRLHFRNDMYASTRYESEGEFYSVLGLSKLLQTRGFDTTIDIIAAHDDPTITPREAAAISRMSPYLSLSVQLSRASMEPDAALAENKFAELGYTAEGLQVLRKVS
ncbi:unnamed protein product [Phytophthora fragariaefolia]|uniref:Unnamed protein product n=1 Tax=Phytophthora fragariaefolia TaxID=1490495 RepID=A0A9W7D6X7_9STRA|nr:unnamed protein product [Phytophthora fragariaefolia]